MQSVRSGREIKVTMRLICLSVNIKLVVLGGTRGWMGIAQVIEAAEHSVHQTRLTGCAEIVTLKIHLSTLIVTTAMERRAGNAIR